MYTSISSRLLSLGEPNISIGSSSSCSLILRPFATDWIARIHSSLKCKYRKYCLALYQIDTPYSSESFTHTEPNNSDPHMWLQVTRQHHRSKREMTFNTTAATSSVTYIAWTMGREWQLFRPCYMPVIYLENKKLTDFVVSPIHFFLSPGG